MIPHRFGRRALIVTHSAATLCYRLLEGPASLAPLRVLAARRVDWREWRVTFTVLGASHAVSFQAGERQLVELLTCAPPATASPVLMERGADLPGQICVVTQGLLCRVSLSMFSLEGGDGLRGAFAAADQLAVPYPAAASGGEPFTRIGWRIAGRRLEVETVHTYPEEGQGVRSESRFEAQEAA